MCSTSNWIYICTYWHMLQHRYAEHQHLEHIELQLIYISEIEHTYPYSHIGWFSRITTQNIQVRNKPNFRRYGFPKSNMNMHMFIFADCAASSSRTSESGTNEASCDMKFSNYNTYVHVHISAQQATSPYRTSSHRTSIGINFRNPTHMWHMHKYIYLYSYMQILPHHDT